MKFDNIDEIQLDLVYGQLLEKIKASVLRESISNLVELVEKADRIEGCRVEKEANAACANANVHQSRPEKRCPSPLICITD